MKSLLLSSQVHSQLIIHMDTIHYAIVFLESKQSMERHISNWLIAKMYFATIASIDVIHFHNPSVWF